MYPLKSEVVHTGKYRVLALPFGGPIKGKDMDGEYFSKRTDPKPEWFTERPVLFHHGLDRTISDSMIGRQGPIATGAEGWWADLWIDKQNKYFAQIEHLISSGRMYGSSGSMPHLVKKAADGELLIWPHIEQTLSPLPRNPYSVVRATKALDDYSEAGLDVSRILAELQMLSTDLRQGTSATGDSAAKAAINRALDDAEAFLAKLRSQSRGS